MILNRLHMMRYWNAMMVLLILACSVQLDAKSYEIPRIETNVVITADGRVQIEDKLTYRFDGSFTWADYRLPKMGYSRIRDIRITEASRSYTHAPTQQPGTFSLSENEDYVLIKWNYQAEDEERTFTISYQLEGAITIGPEWSQFFWNLVSSRREKQTDSISVTIHYPGELPMDSLYTWSRGPGDRIVLSQSKATVSLRATDIGADEFVKVRTVFPSRLFNRAQSKVNDPDFSLSWARADEAEYRQKMDDLRTQRLELLEDSRFIHASLAILSLFAFLYLYRRYGKRHSSSRWSSVKTVVRPDNLLPAAIGWLLSGRSVTSNHLLATVLDLARRGYFKLEEQPPSKGFLKKKRGGFHLKRTEQAPGDDLTGWERELVHFVEQRLNDGARELQEVFSARSSEVRRWFSNWKTDLKSYCMGKHWIDRGSYTGVYWNVGVQGLLLLALIVSTTTYTGFIDPVASLITIAIVLVSSFLSFVIIRRTEQGEEVYHEWNNYKRGLKEAGEHTISKETLDTHFIYAIALGIRKDHLKTLVSSASEHIPVFAWLIVSDSSAGSIAGTLSSLGASGTSAFVGTSAGAGASAGTAGGGASAGAG